MDKPLCRLPLTDDYILIGLAEKGTSFVESLMRDYWLTGAQLRPLRKLVQRALNAANKCFNGPELNQVSYKYIVANQTAYTALLKEIDAQLATREPAGGEEASRAFRNM